MTTDKTPTDSELQERCAEIVEWQRTGVLPGNALRNYAAKHWAGHTDALQMAERDTSALAMEQIAKWGSPVVAGEPWGASVGDRVWVGKLPTHVPKLAEEEGLPIQWLYTTPQPTQAQAGAVPLTDEQIKDLQDDDVFFGTCRQIVRAIEAAHGIKEGGQHAE